MRSKRRKLLISILLALVLSVCVGAFWSLFTWYRLPKTQQSSDKLASAEGWKISHYRGNKKVYQASIESFSIERAKLGPFAIGPLQVAHFKKVVIDFYAEGLLSYADADKAPSKLGTFGIDALEGPLADIKKNLLFRSRKIGIMDIMGISLNLWESEKRVFKISSDRATIDRQTGDIIFTGHASLESAENGSIISYRMRWVKKTSLFRIKDPFIFTKGDKKREGRELETDYLLKKIKFQINK
jgi:hypothetical protein